MKNYEEYLNSFAWKAIKKLKLEQSPQCEVCWVKATTVHHLSYERLWREKEEDLVSICESCHNKCHYVEGYQIKNSDSELRKRFEELRNDVSFSNINVKISELKEGIEWLSSDFFIYKWCYYFWHNNYYLHQEYADYPEYWEESYNEIHYGKKIINLDINTFCILPYLEKFSGYCDEWWDYTMPRKVDYCIDKNYVYYQWIKIEWSSPDTFEIIEREDSSNVGWFYWDNDIGDSCFSWETSPRYYYEGYCKDKNSVYYEWKVIEWVNTESFEMMYEENYYKDKNSICYKWKVIEWADVETFKNIWDDYFRDNIFIYYKWKKIEWADVETFQKASRGDYGEEYYKDRKSLYYEWIKLEWSELKIF